MPSPPTRPSGTSTATNTSLKEGSPPRIPCSSDRPFRPNEECSDLAALPDLLVMLHHSPNTPTDKRISSKYFFNAHPSSIPVPSPASQPSTISPYCSSSSTVVLPLPSRSSSLPTTPQSPLSRINPQYSALQEGLPTRGPTTSSGSYIPTKPEISMARQISISRRQRHMVVPIISRRTE